MTLGFRFRALFGFFNAEVQGRREPGFIALREMQYYFFAFCGTLSWKSATLQLRAGFYTSVEAQKSTSIP
jgi:hypothetical protein